MKRNCCWLVFLATIFTTSCKLPVPEGQAEDALTVERPVAITLAPTTKSVSRGVRSNLILELAISDGIWVGAAEGSVRAPGPTRLSIDADPHLSFGKPMWPEPKVEGIPVRLGTTRILSGRVQAVVPYSVAADCPLGPRHITMRITYTPGLNAGHLTSHIDELIETDIEVVAAGPDQNAGAKPTPSMEPAKELQMARSDPTLPGMLRYMSFPIEEETAFAKALHTLWLDPENHGKRVNTLLHPFAAGTKNTGFSIGAGVAFINSTREGVGTGLLELRVLNNEYTGATVAIDIISCPAAYHNYEVHAFYGENENRGVQFHTEDLTLHNGEFGYEVAINAFKDGRFRFFGNGNRTDEADETAFTQEENGAELDLFWNFATNWRIGIGGKLRDVDIGNPTSKLADEEVSIFSRFSAPGIKGLSGGTVAGARATLIYDHRNQEFTPSDGTFISLRSEIDSKVDDNGDDFRNKWSRFEILGRQYLSTPGQKYTLILSNRWEFTTADDIPFWEQATLGGSETLRAFDIGRFVGRNSMVASIEVRTQVGHMVMLGMPMDVEMAPFVDAGQVFDTNGITGRFNINPGMSMRVLNRPNVGIIINAAYGQDGVLFTGNFGLPF